MLRRLILAAIIVLGLAAPGRALADVTLVGQFTSLESKGCYPIRVEISPQPVTWWLELHGNLVVTQRTPTLPGFPDANCNPQWANSLDSVLVPAGQAVTLEFNMLRNVVNDTREKASIVAVLRAVDAYPEEYDAKDVRFVDVVGLIVLNPLTFQPGTPGVTLDRNGCYYVGLVAYPDPSTARSLRCRSSSSPTSRATRAPRRTSSCA